MISRMISKMDLKMISLKTKKMMYRQRRLFLKRKKTQQQKNKIVEGYDS